MYDIIIGTDIWCKYVDFYFDNIKGQTYEYCENEDFRNYILKYSNHKIISSIDKDWIYGKSDFAYDREWSKFTFSFPTEEEAFYFKLKYC